MNKHGFDISIDELDNDLLAVNFDKNGKAGGYISIKFDEEGVVVDIFSVYGDVLGSTWVRYPELEPSDDVAHQDPRL